MNLEQHLEKAKEAVLEAGKRVLAIQRSGDLGVEYKKDGSPSTRADREAEQIIRGILLSRFPKDAFEGEEFGLVLGRDGYKWHCDPVDGTWCLINGEKTASISLALGYGEKTVLAVVYNPFTGELFSGADGLETTLNGTKLPTHNKTSPNEAVYNSQISRDRIGDAIILLDLLKNKEIAKLVSLGGSIAYNLAQVAEGRHNVYIACSTEPSSIWDIAAGVYLVRSVGGLVTNPNGNEPDKILIAATNPQIHKETLNLLAKTNFGKY